MTIHELTKRIFLFLLVLLPTIGFAQFGESIRSDRPGQANVPFTVGTKVFQVQSGLDFSGWDDAVNNGDAILFNNVFRYGLTEMFEIGLGLDYLTQETKTASLTSSESGISTIALKIRSHIYEGEGLMPDFGYQFDLTLPMVHDAFSANEIVPKITIITGQDLGGGFSFNTNFGANWNGSTPNPEGFYILNLGYGLTEKISLFIEQYANFDKSNYNGKIDGGLAYVVNNDLQLDLFGGFDKEDPDYSEWFVSIGASWRMHKR